MFFYLQLSLFFIYNYFDYEYIQILILMLDFYILLFYTSNYSYIRTIKNNNYSLPILSLNRNIKSDGLFIMLNYFNNEILNKIRYIKYNYIEIHLYNREGFHGIICDTMNLSFINKFPNIANNKIKKLIIDKNRFDKINDLCLPRKLFYLSAQRCNLNNIKIENAYLREIYLNDNKLINVTLKCTNLKKLFLSDNMINYLELDCPKLKFLDLSKNLLESLESSLDLDVLNIEHNQFIVLPIYLIKVKRLYLNGNPIIPNLNTYRWMEYFDKHYPEFFQNNIDNNIKNVYMDKELVHNTHINECIKRCIDELEGIYYTMNVKNIKMKCVENIENVVIQNDFRVKNLISTIMFLAREKNLDSEILPIIEYEVIDGKDYCLSGKIGRIITSIMGFELIKNVVSVSKNDEIMTKYDLVYKKISRNIDENTPLFFNKLRNEFEAELINMGIGRDKINEWVSEIDSSEIKN